jgi:CelD/BcsL family acetyltransferase involved in cellulose biosynthesis
MKLELVDPYADRAERVWRALAEATPPSYFLSWPWIENWLACLPRDLAPRLAIVHDAERPVAACFLGRRLAFRHRLLPSRALYLNTTGVYRLDELCIEYNGLVGRELSLPELCDLLPGNWDELFLPGLRADAFGGFVESSRPLRVRIDRKVPAFYVNLERARTGGYLALLSGQTRGQVRRAQREAGEIAIDVASDARQAMEIFGELCTLHGALWRAKGQPGAFADPWIVRFHDRLIAQRSSHGEIQLVRVRGGTAGVIGCLYNLVWRGRVLQYQSGLATFDNAHLKPGYIAHTAAIDHAIASGLSIYDFLAGDMRYKKSLSTDVGSLVWARVQRRRVRFLVEDQLRTWRARRASATAQT